MGIKLNTLIFLTCAFAINFNNLNAQENYKDIIIQDVEATYLKKKLNKKLKTSDIYNKRKYSLIPNSIVIRLDSKNQDKIVPQSNFSEANLQNNFKIIGNYAYNISSNDPILFNQGNLGIHSSQTTEMRVLINNANDIKFTDGSILVKFNEKIDYNSIDLSDNFVIRKKFPTANTIIYQNLDFNTLELKINELNRLEAVQYAHHNYVDPNITSN
jgi:hypothetical protein